MSIRLSGLKVVELARILTRPWIGYTLADLRPKSSKSKARRVTAPSRSASYDFLIQRMSGIMSLTGEPDGALQK